MRLEVIVAETRPSLLEVCKEVFGAETEFRVLNVDTPALRQNTTVDVLVTSGLIAHDRYGGLPALGASQILATRREEGMPPWVVTLPPLAGRFLPKTDSRIAKVYVTEQGETYTTGQLVYVMFKKVFRAIRSFQGSGIEPHIEVMGVSLEFLDLPIADPVQETRSILQAYSYTYR